MFKENGPKVLHDHMVYDNNLIIHLDINKVFGLL